MSRLAVQTHGTVIARTQRGESSLRLHFLSPVHGRMLLIKRVSQKRLTSAPDLFEQAEIVAEAADVPQTYFLREYHLNVRHEAIAKRYTHFECACRFANILDKNLQHAEHFQDLHRLLLDALQAWESQPHPYATLLKALYRLAREEGYPAKEHWFSQLPKQQKDSVAKVLNTPLGALEGEDKNLDRIIQTLQHWLEHHTDILV